MYSELDVGWVRRSVAQWSVLLKTLKCCSGLVQTDSAVLQPAGHWCNTLYCYCQHSASQCQINTHIHNTTQQNIALYYDTTEYKSITVHHCRAQNCNALQCTRIHIIIQYCTITHSPTLQCTTLHSTTL